MHKTFNSQSIPNAGISFITPTDEWKRKLISQDSTWNRLLKNHEKLIDPFACSPQWQLPFHDVFMPNRRLLVHESEDSLVALAEQDMGNGEIIIMPIEASWLFSTPLLGGVSVDLLSEVIDATRYNDFWTRRRLFISGLTHGGDLQNKLWKQFGGKYKIKTFRIETLCRASLEGGFDGYLKRRSTNHRRSLKKQINRAKKLGIYFEKQNPDSPKSASAVFKRMLNIEMKSWKALKRNGMEQPKPRKFYHEILKSLSLNQDSRVIFARHDDNDIGYIFGGLVGNVYRGQQFSFAQDWQKNSVGNLLQYHTIKWLCEEGVHRYDMGPDMAYKHHWTEQFPKIETWMIDLGHG